MSENETIQNMQLSEPFLIWILQSYIRKIFEIKNFRRILSADLRYTFNLKCFDMTIGFKNERDIYSEIKNDEIIFSHGLVSILIKCDTAKILIQSKGVLLETRKESYIMLYSIDKIFIK
jgi:hypothetical protein